MDIEGYYAVVTRVRDPMSIDVRYPVYNSSMPILRSDIGKYMSVSEFESKEQRDGFVIAMNKLRA